MVKSKTKEVEINNMNDFKTTYQKIINNEYLISNRVKIPDKHLLRKNKRLFWDEVKRYGKADIQIQQDFKQSLLEDLNIIHIEEAHEIFDKVFNETKFDGLVSVYYSMIKHLPLIVHNQQKRRLNENFKTNTEHS